MSGGKGGKSAKTPSMQEQIAMQQQMTAASRPKDIQLQTQGYGGMGYNMPGQPFQMGTPQTGQGLTPPSWMQGDFAMPAWGKQAPNVGAAMLMQQMGQDAYRQQYMQPQGLPGAGGGAAGGGAAQDWMQKYLNKPGGANLGKAGLRPDEPIAPAQKWGQPSASSRVDDIFARAAAGLAAAPQGGPSPYAGMPLQEQLRMMFQGFTGG